MPASERAPDPRARPEQDRLGLVVAGVAEQDGDGARALGGRVEGRVAGRTAGGLGAAVVADRHPDDLDRVEAEAGQQPRDLGGVLGRSGLQTVVDGDRADPQRGRAALEGGGGGEGEGVGAAAGSATSTAAPGARSARLRVRPAGPGRRRGPARSPRRRARRRVFSEGRQHSSRT